jgi:hypothetical protein
MVLVIMVLRHVCIINSTKYYLSNCYYAIDIYLYNERNRQEVYFVTYRCQVKISQLTAQDQRSKERKVNNLDMRAALIVAASPSDHVYIYVRM